MVILFLLTIINLFMISFFTFLLVLLNLFIVLMKSVFLDECIINILIY